MVDLSVFDRLQAIQEEGREFPIFNAAGDPTEIKIKVFGPDSKAQRDAKNEAERYLTGIRASGREPSDAESETYVIMRLRAAVGGWSNLEDENGAPLPFTRDNAEMLLRRFPIVHDQVKFFASTRTLFSDTETTTSTEKPPATKRAKPRPKRG
ncbi:hypothetical protein BTR14_13120 [Rhizobium rhizosphaerae]|uniref:Tail assembly chaperone n=1 Tax=Xaviernesmea rhizosphaerae TaxID=1672749 RepID=A0ABX3PD77_9HYPH|nr:hypothetical protein [Xaviernesmea rhizosphaerae]OQP86018.1 hypothetical protein BTR14_13120 [Xaviernesmea rhizosphaerae]